MRLAPRLRPTRLAAGGAVRAAGSAVQVSRAPLYKFSGDSATLEESLSKFERIDDVIMGGVSKSQLGTGSSLASWRGLVRTEGGGFCGQRTKPFVTPLNLTGADGLYIKCRLASDSDAERRVWKLTLRTDEGRGEVVYQASYVPPVGPEPEPVNVPFSDFVLVRGPVAIPGAPKVSNVSAIYQLGMTVSKFVLGPQMTELENFRNGTFQLDISELGVYTEHPTEVPLADSFGGSAPAALSEREAQAQRPWLLRMLILPLFGLVFSESKRRRSRAAKLLTERGASKLDLVRMGWRFKRQLRGQGPLRSAIQTLGEVLLGIFGTLMGLLLAVTVFPIFRLLARRRMRKQLGAEAEKATRL